MGTVSLVLAQVLTQEMEKRGLSQRQLAELVGAPEASVSRWLNNGVAPRDSQLARIAVALDLSMAVVSAAVDETRIARVRAAANDVRANRAALEEELRRLRAQVERVERRLGEL